MTIATEEQQDTFTDPRDGKAYRTVKIGEQIWMAENLNFDCPESKCYDNDPKNAEKYGRLYNWETAMKVCPLGWHLPSEEEWETLVNFAGGDKIAGKKLKAKNGWENWNNDGNGTDSYGFSALPGGLGDTQNGCFKDFKDVGILGGWWSSSECDRYCAYTRNMYHKFEYARWFRRDKHDLFSVRCLQD